MNEEQKAYINELLKKDSISHGLGDKTINYNGEQVDAEYLLKNVVRPARSNEGDYRKILAQIVNDNKYIEYNNWIRKKGVKSNAGKTNTSSYRLVNLVRELVTAVEDKTFSEKTFKVKRKKDNEIDQKIDGTDDEKTTKNEVNSNEPEQDKNPINVINEIVDEINEKEQDKQDDEKSISKITTQPEEEQESFNLDELDLDYDFDKQDEKSISQITTQPEELEEESKEEPEELKESKDKNEVNLIDSEKQLFKNIELALSYKYNKEYQDNNLLQFKRMTGHIDEIDKPSKKLKTLVHQQIAKHMEMLKSKYFNRDEFAKHKQEIIDKINDRYFGENNIYGFKVYNKDRYSKSFEIKSLKDGKNKYRAKKNYVNQNAPNKYSFFVYNMRDIYSIIEEYLEIKLSVHAKSLIESIVNTSVDRYVKHANRTGQIAYHTISHGISSGINEDVIKLIEKYINSKRNIHIKMKFEFDSDARSKLMEIIQKEVSRNSNDYKQKSKNIISFIDNLEFS